MKKTGTFSERRKTDLLVAFIRLLGFGIMWVSLI